MKEPSLSDPFRPVTGAAWAAKEPHEVVFLAEVSPGS